MGNLIFAFIIGRRGGDGGGRDDQLAGQQRHEHDAGARPAGDFWGIQPSCRRKRNKSKSAGKVQAIKPPVGAAHTLWPFLFFLRHRLGAGPQRPDGFNEGMVLVWLFSLLAIHPRD